MNQEEIKKTIEDVLNKIPIAFSEVCVLDGEVADCKKFVIKGSDSNLLIGRDGENLSALSHIIKKIVAKNDGEEMVEKFYVDVEDYHTKKIRKIKNICMTMANRAKTFRRDVELEPMSSYERMIVHSTLADDRSIKTESDGEGKFRKVIIKFVG